MKLPQSSARFPAITINTLIATGFLLALWVATHPHFGIIHDARLYLLQSLYSLEPGEWNQDLYFRYGTQDSFSVFSSGYKLLISMLGISQANLVATIIGDTLWLAGLGLLVCTILKHPAERLAAICGGLALDPGYGGLDIFHYAEPFVTPRLFAEAIVLSGMALAIQRRYIWASILLLLATAIHLLIAILGIGIQNTRISYGSPWLKSSDYPASLTIVRAVQATQAALSRLWDAGHAYTGSAQAARRIASLMSEHPHARSAATGFQTIEVQPYFAHNTFANFHGRNLRPAFLIWKSSGWRTFATLPEAYVAIAAKYDFLLMPTFNVSRSELAQFETSAEKNGYHILETYPGNRVWKGYNAKMDAESFITFGSSPPWWPLNKDAPEDKGWPRT